MRLLFFVITLFVASNFLHAQDPQPTLFDVNLPMLNPAFTGDIEGNYTMRLGMQYRSQWFDAIKDYYNYSAFAFDSSTPICFNNFSAISISPGIYFLQERFPFDFNRPKMSQQKIGLTTAVRIQISDNFYASAGFEYEMLQRSIKSTDALQFGTQYDGLGGFDSNSSNLEPLIPTEGNLSSGIKSDLATGISLVGGSDRIGFRFGLSTHHIRRPVLSLLGNNDEDDARISHRHTAYYRVKVGVGGNPRNQKSIFAAVQIYGIVLHQGVGIWQYNQGLEYGFYADREHYLALGVGARITNNRFSSGNKWTDTYASLRWSYENYTLAFSTDFAHSPFSKVANDGTTTAFELALNYRFANIKKRPSCSGVKCYNFFRKFQDRGPKRF